MISFMLPAPSLQQPFSPLRRTAFMGPFCGSEGGYTEQFFERPGLQRCHRCCTSRSCIAAQLCQGTRMCAWRSQTRINLTREWRGPDPKNGTAYSIYCHCFNIVLYYCISYFSICFMFSSSPRFWHVTVDPCTVTMQVVASRWQVSWTRSWYGVHGKMDWCTPKIS